jgi:hypothetical protein
MKADNDLQKRGNTSNSIFRADLVERPVNRNKEDEPVGGPELPYGRMP